MALVYIHMGGQVLFIVLSTGLIKQTFRNLPFLLLVGLVTPVTSPFSDNSFSSGGKGNYRP
jgi:hypothetical protein